MDSVLEQIREAIRQGKKTRYQISQETGILQSGLARLMTGEKGLSIESLEAVADCLGLEIIIRPKGRNAKKGTQHGQHS